MILSFFPLLVMFVIAFQLMNKVISGLLFTFSFQLFYLHKLYNLALVMAQLNFSIKPLFGLDDKMDSEQRER